MVMPLSDVVSVTLLQTVLCLLLLAEGQTDSSQLVTDSGCRLWCCYTSEGGNEVPAVNVDKPVAKSEMTGHDRICCWSTHST